MLTIGQFSKTCMVTVKALRHYDKIGLINPCYINDENGYRFYSEEQIPEMLLINRLKSYGFSLSSVKDMLSLNDKSALLKKLEKQRNTLLENISDTRLVLNDLEKCIANFERTGDIMGYQNNYKVSIIKTEDINVISNRQNMSVDDFGKYYGYLYKRCADENIILDGKCMAFYHDSEFDPENSDIELALGVTDKAKADKVIKGCECASTTHYGGYSNLPEAYGSITKWIKENGYKVVGAPYEIYVKAQFDKIPVDEWETRIFFPVMK